MPRLKLLLNYSSLLFIFSTLPLPGWAGVIADASRVVFDSSKREQNLMLANINDYPVMVQLWVDNGSVSGTPDLAGDVPVIPLPALFKLTAGEKRNVRLLKVDYDLPKDRESLYWLNIYEVPPKPSAEGADAENMMILTMRTQLKVFIRPPEIEKQAVDAASKVGITWDKGSIRLQNPTPFFITLAGVLLNDDSEVVYADMLAPFSSATIEVESQVKPNRIRLLNITDNGDISERVVTVF